MGLLILESKRDDLLLPYYEKLRQNGLEKSFSDFKGDMLNKLSDQAGIRNLSLTSNYYLAGAVRYYFDGSLTIDKVAKYAETGDRNCVDSWNQEVCNQLNVLIEILRNAYIDTVGASFEQPEDFGTMPIQKLLKKYGKKIAAIANGESEGEKGDGLDRSTNVGNGYTFDILYSHEQAKKYERYTAPGSWCITYGQGHYDSYVRRLDIHYVIFLKDGYENVERKTGPGYTRLKPHDEYGNSMIALLQSNKSWKPIYITSRWNHGAGETSGTEADHAYTTEEFCKITGVTPEDLQRIYNIWKTDEAKYNNREGESRAEVKKKLLDATRKIKYLQMRINGGEAPISALQSLGGNIREIFLGSVENQNKSVFLGEIDNFRFIIDKRNIVLDSISSGTNFMLGTKYFRTSIDLSNMIIIQGDKYFMIYNLRFHEMVNVNGQKKIKCIPDKRQYVLESDKFFEIKFSGKDIALLSLSSLRPLKLPNGECVFNCVYASEDGRGWESKNKLHAHVYGSYAPILEIVYDESSGEKYFYNTETGKFMDFSNIVNDETAKGQSWSAKEAISSPADYELILDTHFAMPGFFALRFHNGQGRSGWYIEDTTTKAMLFRSNGQRISIMGIDKFSSIKCAGGKILTFKTDNENDYDKCFFYDTFNKKVLSVGNEPLRLKYGTSFSIDENIKKITTDEIYVFENPKDKESYFDANKSFYNLTKAAFAINPYDESMIRFNMADRYSSSVVNYSETGEMLLMNPKFNRNELWVKYRNMGVEQAWDKAYSDSLKHAFRINFSDLKWLPVGLPTNNEADTNSIGEREVAQMVREVLNKLKTLIK